MPRLLVVDDDRSVHLLVEEAMKKAEVDVTTATTAQQALDLISEEAPDVLLLDVILPDLSGLDAFRRIQEIDRRMPVLVVTGSGGSETAIEAMKLGAFDYLQKPIDLDKLERLVMQALESRRLVSVPVGLRDILGPDEKGDAFVGRCPAMQEVFKAVGRVAPQNVPVLIRGESGTGKELVARALFQHSRRSDGPFLAVNCAALSETLLESELFGHEKGAFTGAHDRRIGKFEQCSGGTIFLDEVGDMTPLVQSKVLRLLQEQKFERVGGNETISTDVRIISATNRNLDDMCDKGEFRSDLYYRLNGFTITLPPLRNRSDDRILLLQHFLAQLNKELGHDAQGIAPDALQILMNYEWPGNVRELQSVVKQAMLQSAGPVLMAAHLPDEVKTPASRTRLTGGGESLPPPAARPPSLSEIIDDRLDSDPSDLYADMLKLMETQLLTRVLAHAKGNQSEAARILGITRGSLRNKIRAHNISIDPVVCVENEENEAKAEA